MLVRNCLSPLAERVEAALMRCLLSREARRTVYIEHDLTGLLRGDTAARFEAYRAGWEWGWLSPNDVRRAENLPPIAEGDVYSSPMNMAPVGGEEATSSGRAEMHCCAACRLQRRALPPGRCAGPREGRMTERGPSPPDRTPPSEAHY
jgi:Phage-related protein